MVRPDVNGAHRTDGKRIPIKLRHAILFAGRNSFPSTRLLFFSRTVTWQWHNESLDSSSLKCNCVRLLHLKYYRSLRKIKGAKGIIIYYIVIFFNISLWRWDSSKVSKIYAYMCIYFSLIIANDRKTNWCEKCNGCFFIKIPIVPQLRAKVISFDKVRKQWSRKSGVRPRRIKILERRNS